MQLPSPLATFTMIATFHLKLVDFASQTFVDYVAECFTLSTTVRAAFLTMLLEPLIQTRFTEVLATAHSQVRFPENFGADLTNEMTWHIRNKVTVVSTLRHSGRADPVVFWRVGLTTWACRMPSMCDYACAARVFHENGGDR